ncbi:MAG: putative sulfate exporter family transporter [Pseudonocardiaceae bacterium]
MRQLMSVGGQSLPVMLGTLAVALGGTWVLAGCSRSALTFNIANVLLFPPIGHLLGMNAHVFGLWSGTAINDTSSTLGAAHVDAVVIGAAIVD